jgi:FdhE protein
MRRVPESWDRRVQRAERLAADGGPNASLLAFYARLLRRQQAVAESLRDRNLSGALENEIWLLHQPAFELLREVAAHGPDQLADEARAILKGPRATVDELLFAYWRAPTDRQFFPKAILQPYGERLTATGARELNGPAAHAERRCPRCGGAPQLSVLESPSGVTVADGGGRRLLCAVCLATWPFRRLLCPWCGEEDEHNLVYFRSPELDHLRVDACESCRRYLKSVDLGRLGLAVPLVDEAAGAALDVWARQRGYEKIELNLLGL